MKNYINNGETVPFANASGSTITAGSVVISGKIVGIAANDIADGTTGTIRIMGVFQLTKNAPLAISQGDYLYWNTSSLYITKTNTDVLVGVATEAAASADVVVNVKLTGVYKG